jgi:hypothetical protein
VKTCAGDCNDADATVRDGGLEICDGKDNNCDGVTDGTNTSCYEGPMNTVNVGVCKPGTALCQAGMPSGVCMGQVVPAAETCDAKDNDCDGKTDEDFDKDGDGAPDCALCAGVAGCDCNDADPFNAPGLSEICDCKDNNCNAIIDDSNICYAAPCHDLDHDGVTNCSGDCDDGSSFVGPQIPEKFGNGVDDDCDGAVDEKTDEDGDMFTTEQGDCDDRFAAIYPGATEVCDGFDNNCDGKKDEGFDQDKDGVSVCAGDCNDADAQVRPNRLEVCGNGVDENCNGLIDENLDVDGDGVTTCQGDCNDFNAAIHPAAGAVAVAAEICDGQDNDCNFIADDSPTIDVDKDGVPACLGDCNDADPLINPTRPETPANSKDDNCNGKVDEGAADVDGDGFSPVCGDCNDADKGVHPHSTEVCDRIDNNCDGYVDSSRGQFDLCAVCFDADKDGRTNCEGDCNDADPAIFRGASEICDLKDNDCDGDTDIDPLTGLRVCTTDAGVDADAGVDGGPTDPGADGGAEADADAGNAPQRPSVVTGCGCGATNEVAGWAALALLLVAFKARGRAAAVVARAPRGRDGRSGTSHSAARSAWTALLVGLFLAASGCSSSISRPVVDVGTEESDGGEVGGDAGTDAGFIPPVANWPCPGLYPVELAVTAVPGTTNAFAYPTKFTLTKNDPAQLLVLDDFPGDVAAFMLRRDVPAGVDPNAPDALETVAGREVDALSALVATPLVRDRALRFSRIFTDERTNRSVSQGEVLTFATATNAFAVRNRLIHQLSGRSPADVGVLPVNPSAASSNELAVYLVFRLTPTGLFVGASVTTLHNFSLNQPTLGDLTNGSHLSGPGGRLVYTCEKKVAAALKTDFIFVIDNSGSMIEEQTALVNAADGLFSAFQRSALDFRIGVITTDSDVLRGAGFTSSLDQFKRDVMVGTGGNSIEMGLEFASRALKRVRQDTAPEAYRVREGAGLVVVVLSDEENTLLEPKTVGTYGQDFLDAKAVAFGIVGPRPYGCTRVGLGDAHAGTQYIDVATRTGGSTGSICNPKLAEVIEEILVGSIGASNNSPLTRKPISGSLAVETDKKVARSRQTGFDYDAASNAVLFFGSVPPVGSEFRVAMGFFNYVQ